MTNNKTSSEQNVVLEERIIEVTDTKRLHITRKVFENVDGIDIRWFVKFNRMEGFFITKRGVFMTIETARMMKNELDAMIK